MKNENRMRRITTSVSLACLVALSFSVSTSAQSQEQSQQDHTASQTLRAELFANADSLYRVCKDINARKYSPAAYKNAYNNLIKADSLFKLTQASSSEITTALYYADYHFRHALTITRKVRPLKRNDQTWEKLILEYEALLARIAQSRKLTPSFANGSAPAADEIINSITALSDSLTRQYKSEADLEALVRKSCVDVGVMLTATDSLPSMIEKLSAEFTALVRENDRLRKDQRQISETLEQTEQEKQTAARKLALRDEQDRKYSQLRALFDPKTEALVSYTASQDIVIRLRGLIFAPGTSDLRPSHDSLLNKVITALEIIPGKKIIIEGHTDNTGGGAANRKVSLKRATSVMKYLIEKSARDASAFEALGYGADKPVANNQTERGRADNRRIDIVILR